MKERLMELNHTDNRQYDHLQTLYIVNDMLKQAEADGLNIDFILPRIVKVATMELGAEAGSIIVIDADENIEYGWSVDGDMSYQTNTMFLEEVIQDGIAGVATRSQRTVRIDNTLTDGRWLPRPNHVTANQAWSAVCTPLIARQRAIGALTIAKPGVRQFGRNAVHLLAAIANQAAITIDNARLYAESQRQLRESELFNKASKSINDSLDTTQIMQSMLSQMNDLLNAEAISIAIADGDELVYTVADGLGSDKIVGLRLPSNEGISGWVMEYSQSTMVNSPEEDPRFRGRGDDRTGHRTFAMICAPLEADGRVLGTIQAINPDSGYFTKEDLGILTRLARLASSAIAKAEAYELTQAAQTRYSNLFDDSIDPIIITSLDGRMREVNRRACEFMGYSQHQMVGELIAVLHPEGDGLVEKSAEILVSPLGDIKIVTGNITTSERRIIPVEVHTKRIADNELQWIYHDISKQVELEQMRNDLTAMLFHDLQNPLSNVLSSLELLEMELPEEVDPVVHMMINVAFRSSQRLRHLIRSLLDINQLEAGAPVHEVMSVNVAEMFESIAEMMEAPIERRDMLLIRDVGSGVEEVNVNRDMIERVIINLVDNALKFSKREDTLTVAAQLIGHDCVQISVADEGPGIPEKFRRSIFDKFYRTPDNTSKGIGLGLAFCRLAVEAHGGRIWADEAPSGGAQFNFTLPIKSITR